MSRIGKMPLPLPKGVTLSQAGGVVTVKGPKGELSHELNMEVELAIEDDVANVKPRSGSRFAQAISGTTRALIANMIAGVTEGFDQRPQKLMG